MGGASLVGRDDERARLAAALAGCLAGAGVLVLVSGEAGVGKSRLVTDVLAEWEGCRLSAMARAGAGPYAVLTEVLRAHRIGPAEGDDRAAGLCDALRTLARQEPTVLVLEDLHLADAATLGLLPVLAEALEPEALVVVATYRSDQLPLAHPVRRLRTELRRAGRLVDIALRPLAAAETGQLLTALLGAPPSARLVTAVQQRTDGLPFFVEELGAALRDEQALVLQSGLLDAADDVVLPLPESVRDAVLARTASLRDQHGDALEWAATLGVQVDLAALAHLAGPAAVDALLEAGLLVEFDDAVGVFRHGLVREVLHRSIPWSRRRSHHQQVAELLSARDAAPAVVAEHWIAAHRPDHARPLLLLAAEEHCAVHAYRDAAALAERALELWPEDDDPDGRLATLEKLADCAELSGEPAPAARTWTDVAQRWRRADEPGRAAAAHRRAANSFELLGDLSSTAAQRLCAAQAYADAGAIADAAVERLALAEQLKTAGRVTEALEHAVAATDAAAASGRRDVEAHARAFQGAVRAALGDAPAGIALARSGLEMALAEQLSEVAGATAYGLAEALEYAADYAAAVDAYESAFELCRSHGQPEFAQVCFVCMSPAMRLMGNWDRTLAVCRQVLADDASSLLTRRVAEEESGLIGALRGDRRRARGPLRRAAEFGRANGIFGLEIGATWGLAVAAALEEDDAGAASLVSALLDTCGSSQESHYALPALRWSASFLAQRGDVAGVSTCHRLVAAAATRNGSAKVLSALAHVGAEVAVVEGDATQASASFARSVELLSGITSPYDQALTQLRWGQNAASLGERQAAVDAVSSAYRTARQLGARPLALRCATALSEMGEQADRRLGRLAVRALGSAGLTRRELEVLRHLADGRTNREIAGVLFLSTRTVDMHVRNVLTKLDCTSRTGAVRQATEQGLLTVGT